MISVIVPHLNQALALRRCLASLATQEAAEPFEIIVVDNGSSEMPSEICSSFPNVSLHFQPEPGPGPARNMGTSVAKGDIFAFIDADCVADRGWISTIKGHFQANPGATILGGDVRILCQDPERPTLLEAYESVFAYRMREYIRRKGFTGTGNLAVRASVFAAVGPFGGIGMAEDAEWGQRAGRLGHRISYVPELIVYHPARENFAELACKWDRHTAHDFLRIRSQSLWWLRWVARSGAVGVSPIAELVRIVMSDRVSGSRARALAFLGVTRVRLYRARLMLSLAFGVDPSNLHGQWNRQ